MDQVLAAIHQANTGRVPMTLEFRRNDGEVALVCRAPEELHAVTKGQLYAQYPDCRMVSIPEKRKALPQNLWVSSGSGSFPSR